MPVDGDAAVVVTRDPDGVVIEVKRMMGEMTRGGKKAMVKAAGQELDPEFVSAHILKELKIAAEKFIGEPIHDVVITVPARFKEPQKNATREAAKIANLGAAQFGRLRITLRPGEPDPSAPATPADAPAR